ncbi:hypothetical protein Ddye_014421, partial [Dipteronia dyeriana]
MATDQFEPGNRIGTNTKKAETEPGFLVSVLVLVEPDTNLRFQFDHRRRDPLLSSAANPLPSYKSWCMGIACVGLGDLGSVYMEFGLPTYVYDLDPLR